jgi:hypothetical protein
LHEARTSLKVVPVVVLSAPKAGGVSVGQGLAAQVGIEAGTQVLAAVQLTRRAPDTDQPVAQLKATESPVTPLSLANEPREGWTSAGLQRNTRGRVSA